jgi:hypothetical protein
MDKPIIQIIWKDIKENTTIKVETSATIEKMRLIQKIIEDNAFEAMITDMIKENDSTI